HAGARPLPRWAVRRGGPPASGIDGAYPGLGGGRGQLAGACAGAAPAGPRGRSSPLARQGHGMERPAVPARRRRIGGPAAAVLARRVGTSAPAPRGRGAAERREVSPGGRLLISAGQDGVVRVWDGSERPPE